MTCARKPGVCSLGGMIHFSPRTLSACILSLLLFGCGSKISQKNYDKIKTDMTQQEVESILGKPTEVSSMDLAIFSGTSCVWKDKDGSITVQFVNGKVKMKTFGSPTPNATSPGGKGT